MLRIVQCLYDIHLETLTVKSVHYMVTKYFYMIHISVI